MAKQTYADVNTSSGSGNYRVGYFGINDGQEAVVRFVINSTDDFEIYTVHPITVGQSSYPNRRVSCLRANPKTDPISDCPLCARGEKVQQRMYIKMIQYVNENGQIVPKAVVWDRPAYSYAPQLKSYLDNYGPLTNIVCKIVRHGSGLDTKYDIIPNLNPQIFNEHLYPKDFSDFDKYNVLGTIVMNKSFDEINQFIQTGQFNQNNANVTTSSMNIPGMSVVDSNDVPAWEDNIVHDVNHDINTNPVMDRPVRYY